MKRLLALAFLLCACANPGVDAPPAEPVSLQTGPVIELIARLEEARTSAEGELEKLLEHPDAGVRERAATALGRIPRAIDEAPATRALLAALADPVPAVRAAAAFALGMRADPTAGDKLLFLALDHHEADPEALVRARAIEALSKLARPDLRMRTLDALEDPDPAVRTEAFQGPQRWARTEPSASEVDQRLVAALAKEPHERPTLYGLAALERRKASAAMEAFRHYARAPREELRLFAVRGLRSLAPAPAGLDDLVMALKDPDWRIVSEAVGALGAYPAVDVAPELGKAAGHPNPHVRRCAWESLLAVSGRIQDDAELAALRTALQPYWLDSRAFAAEPSASARAAFLELELPVLWRLRRAQGDWTTEAAQRFAEKVEATLAAQSPVVQAGVARALGRIPEAWARGVLVRLAAGEDLFVAGTAVEALGSHGPPAREPLHAILRGPDNGLRLAAVTALAEGATAADLPAFERAYAESRGEIAPELRATIVRTAGKIGGEGAAALVRRALADEDPFVQALAEAELARLAPGESAPARAQGVKSLPEVPQPGRDYPRYEHNPLVVIRTTRGDMVFELFPAEAPLHVHSFLELAFRGTFDGLSFHRVVPDFVIQGGDPRGDGNGGSDWRGGALRHEISPRKYVRGSLGMPRNEDLESGGGQVFVTHRPTPHLDGRYTIFGELRAGVEVLERIEVGDRVIRVARLPE